MVKKVYNVVLQSAIGDGINVFNETFFYDWAQIPDVPYIVSFSLVSTAVALTLTSVPSLYIDLAQPYNQLAIAQSSPSTYRGQFLGNLRHMATGNTNYMYAEPITNPPTFLNGRPSNNFFTVEIRNTPTTDFVAIGAYSLTLSFEEQD